MKSIEDINLLIGGLGIAGLLSNVVTFLLTKRKYNAEVETILIDNVKDITDMFKSVADSEQSRREKCWEETEKLRAEIAELRKRLAELESLK